MLVVNLFGAPSCGKSTGASYIFSQLKLLGVDCELVTEFAKDLTWDKQYNALSNQLYVSGVQSERFNRLSNKVDIVITDSPLFLGAIYRTPRSNEFDKLIVEEFNKYNNINFLINRVKQYNPNGRSQTEEQSNELQNIIKEFANQHSISYTEIDGDTVGYQKIIDDIMDVWCSETSINN